MPPPRKTSTHKSTAATRRAQVARRRWWAGFSRDLALFVTGLILIINEVAIRTGPERPYILTLLGGMVGLPTFLMAKRFGGGDED